MPTPINKGCQTSILLIGKMVFSNSLQLIASNRQRTSTLWPHPTPSIRNHLTSQELSHLLMRTTHFKWVSVQVQYQAVTQVEVEIFSVVDTTLILKTIFLNKICPASSGKYLTNSENRSLPSNRNKLMPKSRFTSRILLSMISRRQRKLISMRKIWMMISQVKWALEPSMLPRCNVSSLLLD